MTKLPVTLIEAEALKYARDWIARMQQGDFLDLGLSPLHKETGHAFFQRMIRKYALSGAEPMLAMIDLADAGLEDARQALIELIGEYLNDHRPLPSFLADYNMRALTGRTAIRGKQKADNVIADIAIVVLVAELIEKFGLKARRGQLAKRQPSACSVVAMALSETGVRPVTEAAVGVLHAKYWPIIGWR
jgi:hypothetical protein